MIDKTSSANPDSTEQVQSLLPALLAPDPPLWNQGMSAPNWLKSPTTHIHLPSQPQFTLTSLLDSSPLLPFHTSSPSSLLFPIFYHNMLFVSLGIAGTHLVEPARYEPLPKSHCGSTNLQLMSKLTSLPKPWRKLGFCTRNHTLKIAGFHLPIRKYLF